MINKISRKYIQMWLEHDKKNYQKCIDILIEINSSLFTKTSKINIKKSAELMIEAFKIHDDVEEKGEKTWNDVLPPLEKYYTILEMPKETAVHTVNVWKAHHEKNTSELLKSLIEEQKNISEKVIGNANFAIELAGLWFVGAAAHDIRDVNTGITIMNMYFDILLQNVHVNVDTDVINHIGFIPNGNRRYAKQNNIEYEQAYQKATEVTTNIVKWLLTENKANILSFYAVSLDNITKRSKSELEPIYKIQKKTYEEWFKTKLMLNNGIKVQFIGETKLLPNDYRRACINLEEQTKECKKKKFYILVAYSGQIENVKVNIQFDVDGTKDYDIIKKEYMKQLSVKEPVDLVIRTANEQRLSDFLPMQTNYAEFIFLNKYFPSLTKGDIEKSIEEFSQRKRNFGS